MVVSDNAVKAAQKAYRECEGDSTESHRAALTAALPFLPVQGAGVSADARQALDRFSFAAQQWGWQADQGSNDAIINDAKAEFDASYAALERILSALEPSAARELALVDALEVAKNELEAWIKCADENGLCVTSTPHVIDHIDIALASLSSPDHADAGKVEGDGWHVEYEVYSEDEWQAASTDLDGALDYAIMYAADGFKNITVQEVRRRTLPSAPASEGAE